MSFNLNKSHCGIQLKLCLGVFYTSLGLNCVIFYKRGVYSGEIDRADGDLTEMFENDMQISKG